ncbi:hypothetical protein [Streptomyces sp. NPDC058694]|uniref:hypothetical protein n=1 Tax=Streptomyces sp. NPDC058694 TaxID=3346603 RepID=UPI003655771C
MTRPRGRGRSYGRGAAAALCLAALVLTGCAPGGGNGRTSADGNARTTEGAPPTSTLPSASARSPAAGGPAPRSTTSRAPDSGDPGRPSPSATGRVRGPDLSRPAPSRTGTGTTAPRTTAAPSPSPEGRARSGAPTRARTDTVITIGNWSARVVRGGQDAVDACQDAVQWTGPALGTENGYRLRTAVLVGHDYCGFDRFATLPVGSTVTVRSPRGSWTYRVYATYVTPGRGAPAAGLYWGDLTLQSCVGPDTGFSYLMRV